MARGGTRLVVFATVCALGLLAAFLVPSALRGMREEAATVTPAPAARPAAQPRVAASSRKKPRPKPCLRPDAVDLDGGDELGAVRVGVGLNAQQIDAAFRPHLDYLNGCRPDDGGDGHVTYELWVGCDGLIDGIEIVDDSLYEPQMLDCLRDRLMYVDFPAHDQEDGVYFEYPLIFH